MGTETFNKPNPHPCMKYGNQKKASYAPEGGNKEYYQQSGSATSYPNSNDSGSYTYDSCNASQQNKFSTTVDKSETWPTQPSNSMDYKKGSRKGFACEQAGPDIRSDAMGADYGK